MNGLFDKLNLRPQERRVLVVVITIVFIIINIFFVLPHLGEVKRIGTLIDAGRKTHTRYQEEIARTPQYEARLLELRKQGSDVLPAEQSLQLTRTIQSQAQATGVAITGIRPGTAGTTTTNQFFDEQTVAVDLTATDKELVEFLVALGSGDSMVRVRDMDLRPDPPKYKLNGKITLVASYQKKPKTSTTPAGARPSVATAAQGTNLTQKPRR